jgi:hypothetical protein
MGSSTSKPEVLSVYVSAAVKARKYVETGRDNVFKGNLHNDNPAGGVSRSTLSVK